MIVPMKKVAIITQSKDSNTAIKGLSSLGVLHVEHQQPPKGKEITELHEEINLLEQALNILAGLKLEAASPRIEREEILDWKRTSQHIINLWKRKEHLEDYVATLALRISQWEDWGDFEPADVAKLSQEGIFLGLYQIPIRQIDGLPDEVVVKTISTKGGIANCLIVSRKKMDIGYKEIPLPTMGLKGMRERLLEEAKVISRIKKEIEEHLAYQKGLARIRGSLQKELEFHEALNGMGQMEALSYITGYIPYDVEGDLVKFAKKSQWALITSDPSEEDNVPVLLRNPRWVSIISPIFKFLEILPGYRELDISLSFLIFFSIFFGILIGDAGYGAVYFLATFLLQNKARKTKRSTTGFYLFYILSLSAIIWGVLTGTFFGHEWVIAAGYKPLAPALVDEKGLQRFCFFLGALHLSLAHTWRGIIKLPSLAALADAGWICILWAAFFIARVLILGDAFPFFGKWLIIIGVLLVIFFTNPQKNILKAVGKGLGTLALNLMNNFTDVVSYIRLFAVGMAGIAIADAFNAMAAMVGRGNILALVAAALIAFIGHSLAIVLGPVSVLVHGVRLNVLEFSGHANISWSGMGYKPLKS